MNSLLRIAGLVALCVFATGCVTPHTGPVQPPGISNEVRKEIHKLAIRTPTAPRIALTSDLDGKGAATGKSAAAAGLGWLGGTMEAAGDAGEGAPLVLAFGLVTTPIAVAGGALYGAAASDTREAIVTGNQTLNSVLGFAPDRLEQVLERKFSEGVPVDYEFTGDLGDAELAARGFDAVLEIRMESLRSSPSQNRFHTYFDHVNRAELRIFRRPDLNLSQTYDERLPDRAVSSWARDGGRQVLTDLDLSYQEIAAEIIDDFFLRKSIQVQGLEPMSKGWSVGTISGTVPLFIWSARDGAHVAPGKDVDYEVMIYSGRTRPESGVRTKSMRYVPDVPLKACKRYNWKVRAHYENFGEPTASDWSPVYRFKTPCRR